MAQTPLSLVDDDTHPASTPAVRVPAPDEVLEWALRALAEVGRAPFTLYRVRKLISALSRLPDQIEALTAALDRTTGIIEVSLPRMDQRLGEVQETFEGVDGRIENLEATVSELSGNITSLIRAIPGARRTLRSSSASSSSTT